MLVLDFIAMRQKYSRFYIFVTDGLILGHMDLSVNAMLIIYLNKYRTLWILHFWVTHP